MTDRAADLVLLSLGAGVQSTTLALLATEGRLPLPDAAIFADTGWEPAAVYRQLDRLAAVLGEAGSDGMGRRQCTSEYKLSPIGRKVRELLGAVPPDFRRVPAGRLAEQWIGFSTDEAHRVGGGGPPRRYIRTRYPLLDLGMSRDDCVRWLTARGWGDTPKSACIGCPYRGNAGWRQMRDTAPDEWADAIAFDAAIRHGSGRVPDWDGTAYLHRSRLPLGEAPIDHVTRSEWAGRQGDLLALLAEDGDPDGCSPYGCRSGEAVA